MVNWDELSEPAQTFLNKYKVVQSGWTPRTRRMYQDVVMTHKLADGGKFAKTTGVSGPSGGTWHVTDTDWDDYKMQADWNVERIEEAMIVADGVDGLNWRVEGNVFDEQGTVVDPRSVVTKVADWGIKRPVMGAPRIDGGGRRKSTRGKTTKRRKTKKRKATKKRKSTSRKSTSRKSTSRKSTSRKSTKKRKNTRRRRR
tara:strand:+ start:103 stop:699 length:597 start_codon:yes stop_codon:yes gene_type:complete